MGVTMLNWYVCLLPTWTKFYAKDGVLQVSEKLFAYDHWNLFIFTENIPQLDYLYWVLGVLFLILFTFGIKPRASIIAIFILQWSMVHRNRLSVNGEDLVFRMILFHSCFFPWESVKQNTSAFFSNWAVRFAQINLILIYVFSLPVKLMTDIAWTNGDLMYYVFANTTWSRWQFPLFVAQFPVSDVMTWAAVTVEGVAPILIWFNRFRFWTAFTCLTFHILIGLLLHNVFFFSMSMVCGFVLFFPEQDSREILERLNRIKDEIGSLLKRSILLIKN